MYGYLQETIDRRYHVFLSPRILDSGAGLK